MSAAEAKIQCPRCGEGLPEGFTRCDACGAYLVNVPASGPAPLAPAQRSDQGARGPKPSGQRPTGGPSRASGRATARRGDIPAAGWVGLIVGLVLGGAFGYALHASIGPRTGGGMPSGPADIMAGNTDAGATAPGQMPAGMMPPEVASRLQQLRAKLASDPKDLTANVGIGNLLFDSSQWEKAIEHYTTALEIDPTNPDVRVDRAIAYHNLGQSEKARDEMALVTREHPEHVQSWFNLGVVARAIGDNQTAVRAWEQFIKLDPKNPHAASLHDEIARLKRAG